MVASNRSGEVKAPERLAAPRRSDSAAQAVWFKVRNGDGGEGLGQRPKERNGKTWGEGGSEAQYPEYQEEQQGRAENEEWGGRGVGLPVWWRPRRM